MIKLPFSVFSKADSYAHMNGRRVQYDFVKESEDYNNDYMARSTIPDDIDEKKHILFFGDSFIFGDKLSNNETLSTHFEKILNNDEYCVVNLAVNGSSLEHALLRLQQWCNSFPNNIHSIYLGITELSRSTHWINRHEDKEDLYTTEVKEFGPLAIRFDYLVNSPPEKYYRDGNDKGHMHYDYHESKTMHKALTKMITKTNCFKRLEENLILAKYIAKIHNFNVYTFYTIRPFRPRDGKGQIISNQNLEEENSEHEIIKSYLENSNFIYRYNPLAHGDEDKVYSLPCGHWNTLGCELVANEIMNETEHWY
tara:strand:- start:1216 stop:2145 length:930 start_codon:yes stop_codon:yes gene_type:complete